MPHVSRDLIQEFWNETQEKSWANFERTLEHKIAQPDASGNSPIHLLIHMAEDMKNSGEAFPKSVDELHNVINENLGIEERERD
jgi:hypothetical protein